MEFEDKYIQKLYKHVTKNKKGCVMCNLIPSAQDYIFEKLYEYQERLKKIEKSSILKR